jgi:hypothetical protein
MTTAETARSLAHDRIVGGKNNTRLIARTAVPQSIEVFYRSYFQLPLRRGLYGVMAYSVARRTGLGHKGCRASGIVKPSWSSKSQLSRLC